MPIGIPTVRAPKIDAIDRRFRKTNIIVAAAKLTMGPTIISAGSSQ